MKRAERASSRPGASASPPAALGPGARSQGARTRRALAAGIVLIAALVAATPAGSQQDDDPDPDDADHLALAAQTPWVVPGGAFALRLRVDDAPAGAQLRVQLHDHVRTRSEFARTLDGTGLRRRLTTAEAVELDALTDDGGTVITRVVTGPVTGEPVDVELGPDDEGVYPVVVELLDRDDEVLDRLVTHLVRLPDPDPDEVPLGAVVLVPLHAPPAHAGPREIDAGDLTRLEVAVTELLEHPDVAATLVPTPESLAAAVEADPAAAERLARVAAGRTVLDRTWVRLDPEAWERAGLEGELARQRAAGRQAIEEVLGVEPDDGIAVGAVEPDADVVLLQEDRLEPLDEDDFPVTLTRPFEVPAGDGGGGTIPALAVDAALAAHVGSTGDSVLDAHRILADLAVLGLDAPQQRRVASLVVGDRAAADAAFLGALLGGLDQPPRSGAAPLVEAMDVRAALDEVEPAGASGGADADDPLVREVLDAEDDPPALTGLRRDLEAARSDVASYRSVFGPGDPLAAEADQLILTSASSSLGAPARTALLRTALDALRADLATIHAPPRQQITLTAREGQVQLVFANESGKPADVTVELRGDRLEFPGHDDARLLVNLAGSTTRVDLDIRARSSGDAPLDLRVTTPDGRLELARTRITVRTTAFSGVGLVLLGAAALFLAVWWTRTILRERGVARRPAHAAADGPG